MLSFDEARELISRQLPVLASEYVSLTQALNRVLAGDLVADHDIPSFDNSSMDGYALHASDTVGAGPGSGGVQLKVAGEAGAGTVTSTPVARGTVIRIMTGAPLPPGADAVLEQEQVIVRNGSIEIAAIVPEGKNIRRKGEDLCAGQTVMTRGSILRAGHLGVLASLGKTEIMVYRRPKVGILTTGNELIDVAEPLTPGKIRNSNAYSLLGSVLESGGEPVSLGKVKDEERDLEGALRKGLEYDALVTSGGVSVGKYDLVLQTLKNIGVEIVFWKVNIKPGMPVAFGLYRTSGTEKPVPVFALPGNPVSTMVTFLQFVRPALFRMGGREGDGALRLNATLEHDIRKHDRKRHFSRGVVRNEHGRLIVRTTGTQSSGVLSSMVQANCLITLREEQMEIRAGEEVEVEFLS
ncbi:MAG: molybdopterin molybdotransferase MoeA [Ignavibacteriales bacterium]|nr:molybdopterin molybdotransferase MoeA [Ignavibacteriales bacterium]